MGISILNDPREGACLFDNTTDEVFGYVAHDCEGCGLDAEQLLQSFLAYCDTEGVRDVRKMTRPAFEEMWVDFMSDEHDHEARPPIPSSAQLVAEMEA